MAAISSPAVHHAYCVRKLCFGETNRISPHPYDGLIIRIRCRVQGFAECFFHNRHPKNVSDTISDTNFLSLVLSTLLGSSVKSKMLWDIWQAFSICSFVVCKLNSKSIQHWLNWFSNTSINRPSCLYWSIWPLHNLKHRAEQRIMTSLWSRRYVFCVILIEPL